MKKIYIALPVLIAIIIAFLSGWCHGISSYRSSLIAFRYIDGKYGKAFYGIEVYAKENKKHLEVHAKINIDLTGGYYYDCGKIGFASSFADAKKKFGNILFDGENINIGSYRISKSEYATHR